MNKKTIVGGIFMLVLIFLGVWLYEYKKEMRSALEQSRTLIASALYMCDHNKTISAMYYRGKPVDSAPGVRPVQTGSVDISIDGHASTTLRQTISADGGRYANADESFVFWNKGDTALIMRNNKMDLNYTNCTVK